MCREAPQKKGLALNFFEILLNKDKIKLWRTAYSKDAFDKYKESFPGYFFYRYTIDHREGGKGHTRTRHRHRLND